MPKFTRCPVQFNKQTVKSVADDFKVFMGDFFKGHSKYITAAMESNNFTAALRQFLRDVDAHTSVANTYHHVGEVLVGRESSSLGDVKFSSGVGFAYVTALRDFAKAFTVRGETYSVRDDNTVWFKKTKHFVLADDSRLQGLVVRDSGFHGLTAEVAGDYNADGFNINGESMFLSGRHTAGQVSAITVKAVNAVQANGYKPNAAMAAAVDVFKAVAESAETIQKAQRSHITTYISNAVSQGRDTKGSVDFHINKVPVSAAAAIADGCYLVTKNGVGFVQYKIDARGRQYAVGTFNHFDKAGLVLITQSKAVAEDILAKAGVNANKAVKAVKALLAGDAAAAKVFFTTERLKFGPKSLRAGQAILISNFNNAAVAAAVVLSI